MEEKIRSAPFAVELSATFGNEKRDKIKSLGLSALNQIKVVWYVSEGEAQEQSDNDSFFSH